TRCGTGTREILEALRSLGAVLLGYSAEVAIRQIDRLPGITAVEAERNAAKQGDRMVARFVEEFRRFTESPLPAPELAEPGQSFAAHSRTACSKLAGGRGQLL